MVFIEEVISGLIEVMTTLSVGIAETVIAFFTSIFLTVTDLGVVDGLSNVGWAVVLGIGIGLTYGAVRLVLRLFKLRG